MNRPLNTPDDDIALNEVQIPRKLSTRKDSKVKSPPCARQRIDALLEEKRLKEHLAFWPD